MRGREERGSVQAFRTKASGHVFKLQLAVRNHFGKRRLPELLRALSWLTPHCIIGQFSLHITHGTNLVPS